MPSVKSYFDTHGHHHAYQKEPNFYKDLVTYLLKNQPNKKLSILDVGCGSGSFIKAMIDVGIDAKFMGVDISSSMIDIAKDNLSKYNGELELRVIDGLDFASKLDSKYDVIHIDSVLHHLIAATQGKSMQLVNKMIISLTALLAAKGSLIVEEVFYNSYMYPKLTSRIIFYGLKILNALKIDISGLSPEIQLGLEVNFMHERELEGILRRYGKNVFMFKKNNWTVPRFYRCFLLKNLGHISYVMQV